MSSDIAKKLGVKYLADTDQASSEDINGIIWGDNKRIFVPLTVEIKGKKKIVIFLVDTGSPHKYISQVLHSMGYESVSDSIIGFVNGREHEMKLSPPKSGKRRNRLL